MTSMIDSEKTADRIIRSLRKFTNPERRAHTVNYFPSAMENLGVSVVDLRKVVREMKKVLKTEAPATVLDLASAILDRNTLEGRQVAYEIVANHPKTTESLRLKDIEGLGRGMDNWTSVDAFATTLAGQAWREGRIRDAAIKRWARSKDRWWRRAAVVSTVPLNMKSRGGSGDSCATLMICEMVASDHDDMVAKGLSWALRSLVPVDPEAVLHFQNDHAPVLHKRVIREVGNKLKTGRKNK